MFPLTPLCVESHRISARGIGNLQQLVRLRTGAKSTSTIPPKRLKCFPCALLLVALGAIALFVAGPLMGSVDDDNDGSPDIPVVVSLRNEIRDVPGCIGRDQQKSQSSVVRRFVGIQAHHLGIDEPVLASHDGRSTLQSFCLLRC